MSKKIVLLISLTFALSAQAAPLDLSGWSALTLDYSGGQPAGNWELNGDKTAVTQTVNADPSFYLNNLNQTSYSMNGSWQSGGGDDDYMGFVFGYKNSSNFYLFDWKSGSQGYVGTMAAEGMTVKKMTGGTGNGLVDLSLSEFWENEHDFGDMDVLATNHGSTEGWVAGRLYNFNLDFEPGTFSIVVKDGDTELWNTTVNDNTFTSGQFGFYNFSQANVLYSGFEQEGGIIVDTVPAPGAFLLAGLGASFVGYMRRRRSL